MTVSAEATLASFARIAAHDGRLNCFTDHWREAALADAAAVDHAAPGPLAGATFAVKNLFDVAGKVTLAGSRILAADPPAKRDAFVVSRLKQAGAVLVGALNMDEFAYGFSTENEHHGATRNPHDPGRIAGGSSGGSAAAVASGMVRIALGSDTNGSIRIPAALCGIYGLKPTFGRLSRRGTFPFVASLDHVGPFAASLADLALAFDAMQGFDPDDPAMQDMPSIEASAATVDTGRPLRVARLGGWFARLMTQEVQAAVDCVARAAGAEDTIELPHADAARSAAFVISAAEGGQLHRTRLSERPQDFDFATRDRLFAGALLPAAAVIQAQRMRSWFRNEVARIFARYDVLVAPTTFTTAPRVGQAAVETQGEQVPVRANLGIYTQPLSFIGLPVISAPVAVSGLPVGVQLIGPPWREDLVFRLAAQLEARGVLAVSPPPALAGGSADAQPAA